MDMYCSWDGGESVRAKLEAAGWGQLIVAGRLRSPQLHPYAIDNGAWRCHTAGEEWSRVQYMAAVRLFGDGASWVVLPDIVAGGLPSLDRSLAFRSWTLAHTRRALIAVQDGMTPADVVPHMYLGDRAGIFVGGSTEWKWSTLPVWGRLAKKHGVYLHVGRVNSMQNIDRCRDVGAHSFDGNCPLHQPRLIGQLTRHAQAPRLF